MIISAVALVPCGAPTLLDRGLGIDGVVPPERHHEQRNGQRHSGAHH
jgi:hypothetical protein